MTRLKLGVNIDHIASIRQARGTIYPDPVQAAFIAEQAGADIITLHLREDRRHIQDRDLAIMRQTIQTRMNLEMAITDEMIEIAIRTLPEEVCLVPEKREELTTEGGLDVVGNLPRIRTGVKRLHNAGVLVSLFIDPDPAQLDASINAGAKVVELHTGHFADAETDEVTNREFQSIVEAVDYGKSRGLKVNAGHGLHYHNVERIAIIKGLSDLNIGHAIIARAVFTGLAEAVREMRTLMDRANRVL
ncbi:pyridoxine 5'-phosphate synthase [bacterium BMS3Bbin11]|nr:pyridoxine 5'-phosphate synthase [bacterium BMS3Abin11]GBE45463.1 pyridoxine 5'-phosphate synthase [bacterium BMS3Bbin11]GMT40345.1 MAG: pyridoxine 5'-phosphate synthase [bacterium]HDH14925.1 pyridoxine 5'-phosphate synthase [Gammaproteobacteria bacterium]HDZ77735.1 pyridoxine 5'-phosphate synthase [Gammaproteobacteria bacterium]